MFFLCGYGGTRKTFIWSILSSTLHSKGKVLLTVASSGITSFLLPRGRTTHLNSKFQLEQLTIEFAKQNRDLKWHNC